MDAIDIRLQEMHDYELNRMCVDLDFTRFSLSHNSKYIDEIRLLHKNMFNLSQKWFEDSEDYIIDRIRDYNVEIESCIIKLDKDNKDSNWQYITYKYDLDDDGFEFFEMNKMNEDIINAVRDGIKEYIINKLDLEDDFDDIITHIEYLREDHGWIDECLILDLYSSDFGLVNEEEFLIYLYEDSFDDGDPYCCWADGDGNKEVSLLGYVIEELSNNNQIFDVVDGAFAVVIEYLNKKHDLSN